MGRTSVRAGVSFGDQRHSEATGGVFVTLAACWIAGVVVGHETGAARVWLVLAAAAAIGMAIMLLRRRWRAAWLWLLVMAVPLSASWTATWEHDLPADTIARYLTDESQLAILTGVVDGPPRLTPAQHGAFAQFSQWQPPQTQFVLRCRSILADSAEVPASGRLLVKIRRADTSLCDGQTLGVIGWLSAIDGPFNPGDRDYRALLQKRGIDGRLSLDDPGNYQVLAEPNVVARAAQWRRDLSDAAAASLTLGMDRNPQRLALLNTVLLGRWGEDLDELQDAFRRTGLAHILSISGAHLAILLGLVWLLARLVVPHPRRAALVVLAVLIMYAAALPMTVPIMRAGLMAGLFCVAYVSGRRIGTTNLLALACLILLAWNPGDLFTPGFQLSFGITAGLLLFTGAVSRWIVAEPAILPQRDYWLYKAKRWGANVMAANLVGFGIAAPLVAYHFGLFTPLAAVLSIFALPVVTLTLALGFAKIAIGLALPSGSMLLAHPLAWAADAMIGLATHGSDAPLAAVDLPIQPSPWWTLASLAVVLGLFTGRFARRRLALGAAMGLCALWLTVGQHPSGAAVGGSDDAPAVAARLTMFAVGDGSCYLLRLPGGDADRRGHTLMFDCGSGGYMNVGAQSVAPSLALLGVLPDASPGAAGRRRTGIDTLMLSHVDLDHINGSLDVADRLGVGRVLVTPQFLANAERSPDGPAAFLVNGMQRRGVPVLPICQGWQEQVGDAKLAILWPPAERRFERHNDSSLVLSVHVGGRRVMLHGDIQQEAVSTLLAEGADLRADVVDLPHHGSMVEVSRRWLAAADPTLVLQSTGPVRLRQDKWAAKFEEAGITRLVTHRHGMVNVTIGEDGGIRWETFREPSLPLAASRKGER
ncbi:MAG: ComEC/Rec2 family competence protein [Phycisphaeraceae bacterium]